MLAIAAFISYPFSFGIWNYLQPDQDLDQYPDLDTYIDLDPDLNQDTVLYTDTVLAFSKPMLAIAAFMILSYMKK